MQAELTALADRVEAYIASDGSFIRVKWPTGGWLVWNWLTGKWDSKSNDETELLAASLRALAGRV